MSESVESRGELQMTFLEPRAESRFDTAMAVGLSTVALLASAFLGLMVGMVV
jgi:hypothetical protein